MGLPYYFVGPNPPHLSRIVRSRTFPFPSLVTEVLDHFRRRYCSADSHDIGDPSTIDNNLRTVPSPPYFPSLFMGEVLGRLEYGLRE